MSRNNTLWLVAVTGPRAGEIHELAPGRERHLPLTDDQDALVGPFLCDDQGVQHPFGEAALNLFDRAGAPLRPGDLVEVGDATYVLCARPPSWELPDQDDWMEQLLAEPQAVEPPGFQPPTDTFEPPDLERVGRHAPYELDDVADAEPVDLETLEQLDEQHAQPDPPLDSPHVDGPFGGELRLEDLGIDEQDLADWDPAELGAEVARALGIAMLPPIALPRVFHSIYLGAPFEQCLMCEQNLLSGETPYLIEKVFRGRQTILECALCVGCATEVNSEMSEESRLRLEAFGNRVATGDAGLTCCRACGTPRADLPGFNILATAVAGSSPPASWTLLCSRCTDGLEKLLSKETRDIYRGFVEDNFPGVPVDLDLPAPVFF